MARFTRNRSYYTSGGSAPTGDADDKEWIARVDKNAYYRTNDILNGVFKKNLRLEAGRLNATDLKTIWVNFSESRKRVIVDYVGPGKNGQRSLYLLDCGHESEDKAGLVPTSEVKCWTCGAQQSYLGFEHEWQHNAFGSNLVACAVFCDQYADQVMKTTPNIDREELKKFLWLFCNAFDDIRCNSLWEYEYYGSAMGIWERWTRITTEMGEKVNSCFLSYCFAVALDVPTDPKGEFEGLRPAVDWGMKKVRYRNYSKMLVTVRAVLDRCMGALLAKVPPPPPQPSPGQSQQSAQQQPKASQDQGDPSTPDPQKDQDDEDEEDAGQPQGGDPSSGGTPGRSGAPGAAGGGDGDPSAVPTHIPSGQSVQASPQERADALKKMMAGAQALDDKEDHPQPDPQVVHSMDSQAVKAMVAKAMGMNIDDLTVVDAQLPDQVDPDMAQVLAQLKDAMVEKSNDSQLTSDAKARILLISVQPEGVRKDVIELDELQRATVQRMRTAFFRSLGRQKAKMAQEGQVVDVPSAIEYFATQQDPDIFVGEATQQGFAYSILSDMSGSMHGTFRNVCQAAEMLKQALKFPFVTGQLWGFRGGESVPGRQAGSGEVWIYRYEPGCRGYIGTTKQQVFLGSQNRFHTTDIPVSCGGLTPMNSAINVVVKHMWRKVPASMAKRLFILTDGSPVHTKTTGAGLPSWMLQKFVAQEIEKARKHGIQVYTIVIGQHAIGDDECRKMFGPPQFWKKTEPGTVNKDLSDLVHANFQKYLKTRG